MNKDKYGKIAVKLFGQRAKDLIENPDRLKVVLKQAEAKLMGKDHVFKSSFEDIKTSMRMLKRYFKNDYTEVNKATVLYLVLAIVYFVAPLDLVPDFIPISGLIDDYSVIIWVLTKVKSEIEHFKRWESRNPS